MQYAPHSSDTLCIEAEPEKAPARPLPAPQAPSTVTTRQRVLVLDDDDDFRSVLADFLVTRFFEVTAVRDGAEGLREILKDPFDLIVCDMMMPQVSGEMFYWAVSRLRPAARLRFLFITGYQNDPTVQAFFQRVNATVLTKPFTLEAMNTAMHDVARKLRG